MEQARLQALLYDEFQEFSASGDEADLDDFVRLKDNWVLDWADAPKDEYVEVVRELVKE